MIKAFIHDGRILLTPHYLDSLKDVEKYVKDWKTAVFPTAKSINADHFIYAVKKYDDDSGEMIELHLHQTPLDDGEFLKRTKNITGDCFVGAWHKGTAY